MALRFAVRSFLRHFVSSEVNLSSNLSSCAWSRFVDSWSDAFDMVYFFRGRPHPERIGDFPPWKSASCVAALCNATRVFAFLRRSAMRAACLAVGLRFLLARFLDGDLRALERRFFAMLCFFFLS